MPDDDDQLSDRAKQLYRKTHVPHKFCPYCGTKNEADAERCSNCGKDISWMKVPESTPPQEAPYQPPRSLPEQKQPVFSKRAIIVFILILLVLIALILTLVLTVGNKSKAAGISSEVVRPAGCPGSCPMQGGCPCPRSGAPPHCGCR